MATPSDFLPDPSEIGALWGSRPLIFVDGHDGGGDDAASSPHSNCDSPYLLSPTFQLHSAFPSPARSENLSAACSDGASEPQSETDNDEDEEGMDGKSNEEFWSQMELVTGVKPQVSRRISARQISKGDCDASDKLEQDIEKILKRQASIGSDYTESLFLILLWALFCLALVQYSGLHWHFYRALRPLLMTLTSKTFRTPK
jgi:hypothetical protein